MRLRLLVALLLVHLLVSCAVPAAAEDALRATVNAAPEQQLSSVAEKDLLIRDIDRKILLELVRLAEFNVQYQQTVNHTAKWRNVAYPSAQEATYACLLGYSTTDLCQGVKGWDRPRLISRPAVKRAITTAAVGSLIGGTSSMVELAANGAQTVRANKMGFSLRASLGTVQSVVTRVNEMLAERHALMIETNITGAERELLELKEQLLNYERDRLIFEFIRWSSHARGFAWYKNAFYVINSTVNLSRFGATMVAFAAFSNSKCGGALGPIQTASSFLAGAGPGLSTAIGDYIERRQKRSLSEKLPASPTLSDAQAKQKFERLTELMSGGETGYHSNPILSDLVRLREENLGLDKLISHEDRNIQRLRQVAGQQERIAPAICALGFGAGILTTIGYYGYRDQPRYRNRLGVAGDISTITAEGVALVATPAAYLLAYVYEHDLLRKGEHPTQLLSKRLAELKTLEGILQDLPR